MARRALIWHLLPAYIFLIVASLATIVAFSATSLRTFYLDEVALDLHSRAAILQPQIRSLIELEDRAALQELCQSLGATSATRITVIVPDGTVIADSEERPSAMDNHASRPEINQAMSGEPGSSMRFSDTLNRRMMYVAEPIRDGEHIVGILRVALPVTTIEDTLSELFVRILYASAAVALLAAAASWIASRRITRPLAELRSGAERFARGQLDHRLTVQHSVEIDALGEAMNTMAGELSNRIDTVIRQKQEQEAVLSSMVEGVLAVDADGVLISINAAAAKLFQVDPDDSIGRRTSEFIRNSAFQDFLNRTLESNVPTEEEITFHIDDESVYQAHGTVLPDESGRSVGAVIVLHDVTQIRDLERVRRDFVSNVSHELRTPITSIKGFVETLLNTPPEDEADARRFLEIIARQSNQLDHLIEDLLSLSRIEQGELASDSLLEPTNVKQLLDDVALTCSHANSSEAGRVEVSCDENLTFNVNAPLLHQAVLNLTENAVKYSAGSDRPPELKAHGENGRVTIVVTDYGPGIPPQHLPRLFERFYRVDQSRSRELGGTGLGLAIVKHIVEMHGGEVNVESVPGKGSAFSMILPA